MSFSKPKYYNNKKNSFQRPRLDCKGDIEKMIEKLNIFITSTKISNSKLGPITLFVDQREKDNLKSLLLPLNATLIRFEVLPVGDFWITIGKKIFYIFERKRLDDLCASIKEKNKRMNAQKLNMVELSGLSDLRRACFLFEKMEAPPPSSSSSWFNNKNSTTKPTFPTGCLLLDKTKKPSPLPPPSNNNNLLLIKEEKEKETELIPQVLVLDEQVLYERWQKEGLMKYPDEEDPLMNLSLARNAIDGATVKRLIRDRMAVIYSEGIEHTVHLLLKWIDFTFEFGESYLDELNLQPDYTLDKEEFERRALTMSGQIEYLRSRRHAILENKEEERLTTEQFTENQKLLIRHLCVLSGVTVDPAVVIVKHLDVQTPLEWAKYLKKTDINDIIEELSTLPLSLEEEKDQKDKRKIGPALILKLYNAYCGTDYEICGTFQKRPRILTKEEAEEHRENQKAKKKKTNKKRKKEESSSSEAEEEEEQKSN